LVFESFKTCCIVLQIKAREHVDILQLHVICTKGLVERLEDVGRGPESLETRRFDLLLVNKLL
jgi:hypothetical protein